MTATDDEARPPEAEAAPVPLPPSVSTYRYNLIGLASGLIVLCGLSAYWPEASNLSLAVIVSIATLIPILIGEFLTERARIREEAGYRHKPLWGFLKKPAARRDFLTCLIGFYALAAVIALYYRFWPDIRILAHSWPEMSDVEISWAGVKSAFDGLRYSAEYSRSFYAPFMEAARFAIPWIFGLAPLYFFMVWALLKRMPGDGYRHLGRLVSLQWRGIQWRPIGRLFRDWAVKAFFLPLMLIYLGQNAAYIHDFSWNSVEHFFDIYDFCFNLAFYLDLIFAATGYAMTFRILGSHIRSSEPTFLGWFSCVMCYAPFWSVLFYPHFFSYKDGDYWGHWMGRLGEVMPFWTPGLQIICMVLFAAFILWLLFTYGLATVAFGYRFSNLTYRGLISSGPYAASRHPAYVCKNLSWWLISLPFLSKLGVVAALKNCIALLGINLIYFIRAQTEERHLSRYPEYRTYALAMNERATLAGLGKVLPILQYRPYSRFSRRRFAYVAGKGLRLAKNFALLIRNS